MCRYMVQRHTVKSRHTSSTSKKFMWTMSSLTGLRTCEIGADCAGESEQGFLTSLNRFVGREEGLEIAMRENQVKDLREIRGNRLFSEDLY